MATTDMSRDSIMAQDMVHFVYITYALHETMIRQYPNTISVFVVTFNIKLCLPLHALYMVLIYNVFIIDQFVSYFLVWSVPCVNILPYCNESVPANRSIECYKYTEIITITNIFSIMIDTFLQWKVVFCCEKS